jgi:hypothetical protein
MILSIRHERIKRVTTSFFTAEFEFREAGETPDMVRESMLKTGRMDKDFPMNRIKLHGFAAVPNGMSNPPYEKTSSRYNDVEFLIEALW